jgi:two-component system chemotaxis response regulator CheB
LPVVIVQHRSRDSELGLCEFLRQESKLPLSEPEDKERILPGHVYLAPRDYHLLIDNRSFALSTEAPVAFARPSIDVLFESAADACGTGVIGVILTGGNRDGSRGLGSIKKHGGLTIVEDPQYAACEEMPRAAIDFSEVDEVLALTKVPLVLTKLVSTVARRYGT